MKIDILATVPPAQRLRREVEDAQFIIEQANAGTAAEGRRYADAVGMAVREVGESEVPTLEVAVGARVDLDHPINLRTNIFRDCTDCGCGLQFRPDTPDHITVWLCLSCTARRIREECVTR